MGENIYLFSLFPLFVHSPSTPIINNLD
jgi:hypothetical protein